MFSNHDLLDDFDKLLGCHYCKYLRISMLRYIGPGSFDFHPCDRSLYCDERKL